MENTQQPISAQPSPAQPVKPVDMGKQSQPKKSNFLTILLSILLLVSLSAAGYFAYQVQNLTKQIGELRSMNNELSTPVATTNTQPTSIPVPTEDPVVGWKTYANTKYGYSFMYPVDWEVTFEDTYEYSNVTLSSSDNKSVSAVHFTGTPEAEKPNFTKNYLIDGNNYIMMSFAHCAGGPGTDCGGAIENGDIEIFNQIISTFKFTN